MKKECYCFFWNGEVNETPMMDVKGIIGDFVIFQCPKCKEVKKVSIEDIN